MERGVVGGVLKESVIFGKAENQSMFGKVTQSKTAKLKQTITPGRKLGNC